MAHVIPFPILMLLDSKISVKNMGQTCPNRKSMRRIVGSIHWNAPLENETKHAHARLKK